ncbi:hypothetical protein H8D29_02685 [PVC group bacterium]|nr:hypothetical protein [PVC group bacterium]
MDDQTTYPNPHTGLGFPTPTKPLDPLVNSNRLSLPFPHEAASLLAQERGERSTVPDEAVAQAQRRMYLMASIMGVWDRNDDNPTAA